MSTASVVLAVAVFVALCAAYGGYSAVHDQHGPIPAPVNPEPGMALTKHYRAAPAHVAYATFSAGCFWGVEEAFREAPGVVATMVGYTGGHVSNPSYELVCTHTTGHAESVRVEYDTDKTSYVKLLDLFWSIHDPTQLNYQGPDYGDSYRSAIFYHSEEQRKLANASLMRLQATPEYAHDKIVTEIKPRQAFFRAEEYHQQYVEKGGVAVCHPRRHAQ
jgi:peptide-methionine (S)-S-oxide reductase